MATLQITLPDSLAADAESAGLLSSDSIGELLREKLKARRSEELFAAKDRMAAVDDGQDDSPEAMAEEIRLVRAERRAHAETEARLAVQPAARAAANESPEPVQSVSQRPGGRKSLAQLFTDSPFKGLDLDFEREPDFGREISL